MLKLEDYIIKRKKADKIDEFDLKKHSENMASVIKYVTDYFNNYLSLEDYDYERLKTQQVIDKFKKNIEKKYPETHEYIISYYWDHKVRLDKYVEKAYENVKDSELFYREDDYNKVAEYVIDKKLNATSDEILFNKLSLIARDYKHLQSEAPSISEMKELDNELVDWVKGVYRKYQVDLLDYARNIASHYYKIYVESKYDRGSDIFYHINKYDYRYQENPFDINDIYARNEHREFIKDKKGELEMIIMYWWLNYEINDLDYWPEYVKLCIDSNRVKLSKRKRVFLPVKTSKANYPCEISIQDKYIETVNGLLEINPGDSYILKIIYGKRNDEIWKDKKSLETLITNLQSSFKKYGAPKLIEFQSPYKALDFGMEDFFDSYQIFEKGLIKFTKTRIAIINGHIKGTKGKEFLFSSIDDILKLVNTCKQLKLRLKLAVNFIDSNRKNILKERMKERMKETIDSLCSIRNFIVVVHINKIDEWSNYSRIFSGDGRCMYLSIYEYPEVSDFMRGLGAIVQDSEPRYLIPEKIDTDEKLETLVDTLYRAGFSFENGGSIDE